MTDALDRLTAGVSGALILFAAMMILSRITQTERVVHGREPSTMGWRLNGNAWTMLAASVLFFRPVHASGLVGRPLAGPTITALFDLIAVSLAVSAFIIVIAARGLARGLPSRRVTTGMLVNFTVALAVVGATWLTL